MIGSKNHTKGRLDSTRCEKTSLKNNFIFKKNERSKYQEDFKCGEILNIDIIMKWELRQLKNRIPTSCHLLFYFTSYGLNMFRILIYPSSGACDCAAELPHWCFVLGSMCVGDSVRLGWSCIRVAGWSLVIQQHNRKLLMMDILVSETCWPHKKWNKIASDMKLVFYSSTITMMHGPINIKVKSVENMWN